MLRVVDTEVTKVAHPTDKLTRSTHACVAGSMRQHVTLQPASLADFHSEFHSHCGKWMVQVAQVKTPVQKCTVYKSTCTVGLYCPVQHYGIHSPVCMYRVCISIAKEGALPVVT